MDASKKQWHHFMMTMKGVKRKHDDDDEKEPATNDASSSAQDEAKMNNKKQKRPSTKKDTKESDEEEEKEKEKEKELKLQTFTTKNAPLLPNGSRLLLAVNGKPMVTFRENVFSKATADRIVRALNAGQIVSADHPLMKLPSRGPAESKDKKITWPAYTSKAQQQEIIQQWAKYTNTVWKQVLLGNMLPPQNRGCTAFAKSHESVYHYSGTALTPLLDKDVDQECAWAINQLRTEMALLFPSLPKKIWEYVLINRYEESDTISAHADDERDLSDQAPIVSLSLGMPRVFRVLWSPKSTSKPKGKSLVSKIVLPHNSILEMHPGMQSLFFHEVAKPGKDEQLAIAASPFSYRLNLTFRVLKK